MAAQPYNRVKTASVVFERVEKKGRDRGRLFSWAKAEAALPPRLGEWLAAGKREMQSVSSFSLTASP